MVRFQWHVEDGFGACIPPRGMHFHADTAVQHVACEIEIPGEAQPANAIFTVPAGYMTDGKVKNVGIILGHGENAEDWKGTLLTELAVKLAQAGYVVVRYNSSAKELLRQRTYEKALDVCATSPFARFVQRWVLGGIGHGARLAAVVGPRARATVAGYVFLSYPLTDSLPTAKGPVLPDSSILLLRISAPALFIHGVNDSKAPPSQVKTVAAQMKPAADVRLAEIADADGSFMSGDPAAVQPATVAAMAEPLLQFVGALSDNKMAECQVARAIPPGQAPIVLSESAAQGIAAQIAVLDEDDALIYEIEPYGNAQPGAAAAAAANGQQQVAQHLLQQQAAAAQLQLQQQAQLAAVMAAKPGLTLQQAAVAQQAAAAQRTPGAMGTVTSAGLVAPMVVPAGVALTPQMLAAAQAMAAAQQAAAKQGPRPAAGAAAAAAAGQQQQ